MRWGDAAQLAPQASVASASTFPPTASVNAELLEVLAAAAATLAQLAMAARVGARAFHIDGMADTGGLLAMGCDEILVHSWDAVCGLGFSQRRRISLPCAESALSLGTHR